MILPSKHLPQDRALLTVGATILRHLSSPITVSALWEKLKHPVDRKTDSPYLRYDSFVLTLDMLYLMGVIDLKEGILHRRAS
jgi:hypothetical protein